MVWVGPEGSGKLQGKVAQIPMIPLPAVLLSFSQSAPMASWVSPYDHLREKEKTQV